MLSVHVTGVFHFIIVLATDSSLGATVINDIGDISYLIQRQVTAAGEDSGPSKKWPEPNVVPFTHRWPIALLPADLRVKASFLLPEAFKNYTHKESTAAAGSAKMKVDPVVEFLAGQVKDLKEQIARLTGGEEEQDLSNSLAKLVKKHEDLKQKQVEAKSKLEQCKTGEEHFTQETDRLLKVIESIELDMGEDEGQHYEYPPGGTLPGVHNPGAPPEEVPAVPNRGSRGGLRVGPINRHGARVQHGPPPPIQGTPVPIGGGKRRRSRTGEVGSGQNTQQTPAQQTPGWQIVLRPPNRIGNWFMR